MILGDLFESRMSELDIEYQDWKNMSPVAFLSRYKMSKEDWYHKYSSLVPTEGGVQEATAKERWTQSATEREKKHNEIEARRQQAAKQGKTDVAGAVKRLEKALGEANQTAPQTFGIAGHKVVWDGEYFYIYKNDKMIYRSPNPRAWTKQAVVKAAEKAIDHIHDTDMSYYKSSPGQGVKPAYTLLQKTIKHRIDKGMDSSANTISSEVDRIARDHGITTKELRAEWKRITPFKFRNTPELAAHWALLSDYFSRKDRMDSEYTKIRTSGGYLNWMYDQMEKYIAKSNSKPINEDQLSVGDPVIIQGTEYDGKTGEIKEFSPSGKFVVVDLYNYGPQAFSMANVKYNEYADEEDQFNEEKVRLDPKCWAGKKIGNPKTKVKGGVRVNNCVPK